MIENPEMPPSNPFIAAQGVQAGVPFGTPEEFWAYWEACKPELLQRCRKWVRSNHFSDVEEALSAAMMHALDRYVAGPAPRKPREWLFAVVRNFCMDLHRNPRSRPKDSLDSETWDADQLHPQEGGVLEDIETVEKRQALELALATMPKSIRAVIALKLADRPHQEICAELNITDSALRKRLQSFRDRYEKFDAAEWELARGKRGPDNTSMRSTDGRLPDGRSVAGYRSPEHAYVVRKAEGGRIAEPVVCFTVKPPQRILQRIPTLEKYIDNYPTGSVKHVELAEIRLLQGDWSSSIELLNEVPEQRGTWIFSRLRLAAMHWHAGRHAQAIDLLRACVLAARPKAVKQYCEGALAFCEGIPDVAALHWSACQALNSNWPLPFHALVGLAFQQGAMEQAADLLASGLSAFPRDRILHYWNCCLPLPPPQSLQIARQSARLFPKDAVAAMQLRRACIVAGAAVPPISRGERKNRIPEIVLDLKLLTAFRAGKSRQVADLLRQLPAHHPHTFSWQAWSQHPCEEGLPASPWRYLVPVLLL
jgi:RNA polymerase sigma factor (sigma-70 family)